MKRVVLERLWRLKEAIAALQKALCIIEDKESVISRKGGSILYSLSIAPNKDAVLQEKGLLLKELSGKQREFLKTRIELERQISKVNDQYVRLALSLHYVDLLTWKQAARIIGGNCTDRALQQLIARYISSEEKEESMGLDSS